MISIKNIDLFYLITLSLLYSYHIINHLEPTIEFIGNARTETEKIIEKVRMVNHTLTVALVKYVL
jgi:hypothetical protein